MSPPAIGDQPLLDFQKRHVRLAANEAEQIIAMGLNAAERRSPPVARGVPHPWL